MAQLMPLPLTVSCSSKIQIGFTFLVPAYPDCPGKEAVKWLSLSNHFLYAGIYRVSIQQLFLPMRRYAGAGASYCPVSISVTSRCSIRRDEWINLVLAWGLLSTSPTLRKFRYLQK